MRVAPALVCVIAVVSCGSEGSSAPGAARAPDTLAPTAVVTVATTALASPPSTVSDPPAPEGPAPVSFTSPSGNILCNANVDAVSCYILEKSWDIPAPDGCEFDWGNEVFLIAGGEAAFGCYSDFSWVPDAPPLAYGDSVTLGTLSCLSEETGMTCTDAGSGAEFMLSRAMGTIAN